MLTCCNSGVVYKALFPKVKGLSFINRTFGNTFRSACFWNNELRIDDNDFISQYLTFYNHLQLIEIFCELSVFNLKLNSRDLKYKDNNSRKMVSNNCCERTRPFLSSSDTDLSVQHPTARLFNVGKIHENFVQNNDWTVGA